MAVEVECPLRRFTADEYLRMAEVGILREGERVELIRGEILTMSPIGPRHSSFLASLIHLLVLALRDRGTVWVQSTVRLLPDTMPEPDLAILRERPRAYRLAHPTPRDIALIIEVAESSLAYDRGTKRALYAEAGIGEYWVVDARAEAIEVSRELAEGRYQQTTRLTGSGTVSPLAFPDVVLRLPDIFG
jgi:Uma2 family endonuclease